MTDVIGLKAIEERLREPLPRERIETREGPGGTRLEYVRGDDIIRELGKVFGPLGWSRQVISLRSEPYEVEHTDRKSGRRETRWLAVATAHVRLTVHPGSTVDHPIASHDDVGHDTPQGPMRAQAAAIEQAEKGAVTDGLKRAARALGDRFGLALYVPKGERRREGYVSDAPREREAPREEQGEGQRDGPPGPPGADTDDPLELTLGWLEEGRLGEVTLMALEAWRQAGGEGAPPVRDLDKPVDYQAIGRELAEDLARVPAAEALDRALLRDVWSAVASVVGGEEARRLWQELGVELGRGATVTGLQARLIAAYAAQRAEPAERRSV